MKRANLTTALILGAALMLGSPATNLLIVSNAVAQTTTAQVQAAVQAAVTAATQAPGYAGLSQAGKNARLAAAVQGAIAAALRAGASATTISAALSALVTSGAIPLSVAALGAAQAAAQVTAETSATGDSKVEATALIGGLSNPANPLGAQIAAAGNLQVAINAINAAGETVTVITDFATVLAAGATGATINANGTVTIGGTTFNPCQNIIADYC